MNLAKTTSSLGKPPVRISVVGGLHPLCCPRAPQTPSLPDAHPRSDRFQCDERESKFLADYTDWSDAVSHRSV